jgi:hypothetical protein
MNVNRRLFLSRCALAVATAAAAPIALAAPTHAPGMQFRTLTIFRNGRFFGTGLPFSIVKAGDIVFIDNEEDASDPDHHKFFRAEDSATRTKDPYRDGNWGFVCREATTNEILGVTKPEEGRVNRQLLTGQA